MRKFVVHRVLRDSESIAYLRHEVRRLSAGLSGELCDDFTLAIHEAVANGLAVANGRGIVVHIALDGDRLTATVADNGPGFSTERLLDGWPPAMDGLSGRGIYLMTRLMDRVSIVTGRGTVVHMSHEIERGQEEKEEPHCIAASPSHIYFSKTLTKERGGRAPSSGQAPSPTRR